ncbi:GDNF family receptor alpha-4-like [Antechinus flavipes]|uniref:GDNF family receptor alpha-4-like n=1 Tax=Antechinus flavipes TaxID=38775 RepID=UPI00223610E3|nr:GDNF family receptor alpha-4-like [Antechinus flavipes]
MGRFEARIKRPKLQWDAEQGHPDRRRGDPWSKRKARGRGRTESGAAPEEPPRPGREELRGAQPGSERRDLVSMAEPRSCLLCALLLLLLETCSGSGSLSPNQDPDPEGEQDCLRASEYCARDAGCSARLRTLRQCSAGDGAARLGPDARNQCQSTVQALLSSTLSGCRCRRGMKREKDCLGVYWSLRHTFPQGMMLESSPYEPFVRDLDYVGLAAITAVWRSFESPSLNDALKCIKYSFENGTGSRAPRWGPHLGRSFPPRRRCFSGSRGQLVNLASLRPQLFDAGSEGQSSSPRGNRCLDAAKACNVDGLCQRLRADYAALCLRAGARGCPRARCHRALRRFFDRVRPALSHALLFCPCGPGDAACAERRRQTIVPACSHGPGPRPAARAAPAAAQPNCLAPLDACRRGYVCRSRLAEFQAACRPSLLTSSGCIHEDSPSCLWAYTGIVGIERCCHGGQAAFFLLFPGTPITPNYVDNVSTAVAPWCSCRSSGNRLEECETFLGLFVENPCLQNAILAFGNQTALSWGSSVFPPGTYLQESPGPGRSLFNQLKPPQPTRVSGESRPSTGGSPRLWGAPGLTLPRDQLFLTALALWLLP